MGDAGERPSENDVRLAVHDICGHFIQQAARVVLRSPGPDETQPVVRVPAPSRRSVDREPLPLDHLVEHSVLAERDARREHVDVMSAAGEACGEALGEAGGSVDIGGKGVGGDNDRQRCPRGVVRRGSGHGVRGQSVRRRRPADREHAGASLPEHPPLPGSTRAP